MKKTDRIIFLETRYVAMWVLLLSLLCQGIFAALGVWDYTVLLGNLLGGGVAVLNFLLMAVTVRYAYAQEEERTRRIVRLSMLLRTVGLFCAVASGVLLPIFSTWTVILPLFFPRLSFFFRPLFDRRMRRGEDGYEE